MESQITSPTGKDNAYFRFKGKHGEYQIAPLTDIEIETAYQLLNINNLFEVMLCSPDKMFLKYFKSFLKDNLNFGISIYNDSIPQLIALGILTSFKAVSAEIIFSFLPEAWGTGQPEEIGEFFFKNVMQSEPLKHINNLYGFIAENNHYALKYAEKMKFTKVGVIPANRIGVDGITLVDDIIVNLNLMKNTGKL